jgi:hypothetical protein
MCAPSHPTCPSPLTALSDFVADLRSSVQGDLATWGARMDGLRSQYVDRASETRASLASVSPQGMLTQVSGGASGTAGRRHRRS